MSRETSTLAPVDATLTAQGQSREIQERLEALDPEQYLVVEGARVHNLKNINVVIPRNALTVITGLSGSGKSSLAFDVIYTEGQRRYLETFSSYARSMLGSVERPDVEYIGGLGPVISIAQRTTGNNPRSTVGTVTGIYDFIRLLYSKAATGYSPKTGRPLESLSEPEIVKRVLHAFGGEKVSLMISLVRGRKGHFGPLFATWLGRGFLYARVDGEVVEMTPDLRLKRYTLHDIDLVIDRLLLDAKGSKRLEKSVQLALSYSEDGLTVATLDGQKEQFYSTTLVDPETGFALPKPEPYLFSFNSPRGWCPNCHGTGVTYVMPIETLIPNRDLPLLKEGILHASGMDSTDIHSMHTCVAALLKKWGKNKNTSFNALTNEEQQYLLYGPHDTPGGEEQKVCDFYDIVSNNAPFAGLMRIYEQCYMLDPTYFSLEEVCPHCHGTRLCDEANCFKIDGYSVSEVTSWPLSKLGAWLEHLEDKLEGVKKAVATQVLAETRMYVRFLLDVGLEYLTLARSSASLSGGEMQRLRLATQIGTHLVNVVYIFDEPSIGLHPRDNDRLLDSLLALRNLGNTILVVEHDEEVMRRADYLVDMGPKAGRHGGQVVAQGTPAQVALSDGFTGRYLRGDLKLAVPTARRQGNGKTIRLVGASGNNLKHVTVELPLGTLICVTGVSGSGKSSLINSTLFPILQHKLHRAMTTPLPYESIEGVGNIDKVIQVDQSPLGRTPRSNPATYTDIFTDIRKLFAETPLAKMRGYKPGRFSFNVKGGRCERCKGAGVETLEMGFLPTVYVNCPECNGVRYNRPTLQVKYKDKNISDVLDMTVNQAAEFFEPIKKLHRKLQTLQSVGLGYIKLGQSCTTISGGESQRVRLAAELSRVSTGKTLYILDEPTTGLHFEDIRLLLSVINALVDKGNTVIVIEHNLDVIKSADYLIDMGPESGERGGQILATGTPEELVAKNVGYTAEYLKKVL